MQASFASKFDVLTRLDVRSKMFIAALAAVMTIALSSLNSQLLLFTTSLLYLFALGRYKLIFVSYAVALLMMALSVGFASILTLFIPSMGKSLELGSLCIPFLRALTVMNTILPMAFTGRLQNILNGLQQLKLPFIIYLPAAVIIRFIPVSYTHLRLLLSWLYRFPSPPALNRAYAARREEFLELRDCHN